MLKTFYILYVLYNKCIFQLSNVAAIFNSWETDIDGDDFFSKIF